MHNRLPFAAGAVLRAMSLALAVIDHLKRLGDTAIELLPLADFKGTRNWGYDGVVITDALMMKAVAERFGYAKSAVMAIEAGARAGLVAVDDTTIAYVIAIRAFRCGRHEVDSHGFRSTSTRGITSRSNDTRHAAACDRFMVALAHVDHVLDFDIGAGVFCQATCSNQDRK